MNKNVVLISKKTRFIFLIELNLNKVIRVYKYCFFSRNILKKTSKT